MAWAIGDRAPIPKHMLQTQKVAENALSEQQRLTDKIAYFLAFLCGLCALVELLMGYAFLALRKLW